MFHTEKLGLILPLYNLILVTRPSSQEHPCWRFMLVLASLWYLWNKLPTFVFPPVYDPRMFKKNIHVQYRASRPFLRLKGVWCDQMDVSLVSVLFTLKKILLRRPHFRGSYLRGRWGIIVALENSTEFCFSFLQISLRVYIQL